MRHPRSLYGDVQGGTQYIFYLMLIALVSFVVLPSAFQLEATLDETLEQSTTRFDKPGTYVNGSIFKQNYGQPQLVDQSGKAGTTDPGTHLTPGGTSGENECPGATCTGCSPDADPVCCSAGQEQCCSDGKGGAKDAPGVATGHYGSNICSSCEGSWELKAPLGKFVEGAIGEVDGHGFFCVGGGVSLSVDDVLDMVKGKKNPAADKKPDGKPDLEKHPDGEPTGDAEPGGPDIPLSPYTRCPTFPGAEDLQNKCLADKFGDQHAAKICWAEVKGSAGGYVGPAGAGAEVGVGAGTITIYDTSMGGGKVEYDLNNPCGDPTRIVHQGCKSLRSPKIDSKPCDPFQDILEDCANGVHNGGNPLPLNDEIILECARGVNPLLFEERESLDDCARRADHADQTGCAYYAECRTKAASVTLGELRTFCKQKRGETNSTCKTLSDPTASNRKKAKAYDNVKQQYVAECVGFYDDLDQPNSPFDNIQTGIPGGSPGAPAVSTGMTCCFINGG